MHAARIAPAHCTGAHQRGPRPVHYVARALRCFIQPLSLPKASASPKIIFALSRKLDVTDVQLARYVAFLARTHAHSTIEQYITNGPRLFQRQTLGLSWRVPSERFPVSTTLTGVKRLKGSGPTRRKHPITLQMLEAIAPYMALGTSPQDRCLWAAWLTMFFGMLRKANTTTEGKATDLPRVIQR